LGARFPGGKFSTSVIVGVDENTVLAAANADFTIHILVQTVNDAAGESFDKRTKLLDLCYPGGSEVEYCTIEGDAKYFKFQQAFIEKDAMCFGFFEMKTNLRHLLECLNDDELHVNFRYICAGYQSVMMEILVKNGINIRI